MRIARAVLILAAFLTLACGFGWVAHPVDSLSRSGGKISQEPDVFVRLSTTGQVCASRQADGQITTSVVVLVNLINLPPQEIKMLLNGKFSFSFYGTVATLDIARAGLGKHLVQIWVPGYWAEPFELNWTVYDCPGPAEDPLRNPDGTLRGYEGN